MAVPVNVRANVRVPFPALVQANFPLSVNKANGVWTFSINISDLANIIAGEIGGIPPTYRATTSTPITVLSNPIDMIIGVDTNAIAAPWTLNLPLAATRNGFPLTVIDITNKAATYNGTIVPAGTETIEGITGPQVMLNLNEQAITLVPITQGAGAPGWTVSAVALNQAITPTWTGKHAFAAGLTSAALIDAAGTIRSTVQTAPTSGAGLEFMYSAGIGFVQSYDRTGAVFKPLTIAGAPVNILGTMTNDNAPAGYVGELIIATISTPSLTSGTVTNCGTLALTAGDWDVWGNIYFTGPSTTTCNAFIAGFSATSPTIMDRSSLTSGNGATVFAYAAPISVPAPISPYKLASSTTVYLNAQAFFSGSTMSIQGNTFAFARRRR